MQCVLRLGRKDGNGGRLRSGQLRDQVLLDLSADPDLLARETKVVQRCGACRQLSEDVKPVDLGDGVVLQEGGPLDAAVVIWILCKRCFKR